MRWKVVIGTNRIEQFNQKTPALNKQSVIFPKSNLKRLKDSNAMEEMGLEMGLKTEQVNNIFASLASSQAASPLLLFQEVYSTGKRTKETPELQH